MRSEFIKAIANYQGAFCLTVDDSAIERLADYYELVLEYNPHLHLVAPCSASEFAIRHILESLALLEHLPAGAKFADVGTGAGLPAIPCLLVRIDLCAVLIESKDKKAKFLAEAVNRLGLENRAEIVNRRFEEADPAGCEFVTSRALDKFTQKLSRLIRWSRKRNKFFFGGPAVENELQRLKTRYSKSLLPLSEQRFLFQISE